MQPLTGRSGGSIIVYSLISGLCLAWVVTLIIIPMLTTTFEYTLGNAVSLFFDMLITVLVIIAVVHNGLDIVTKANTGEKVGREPKVARFSLNQRLQHLWMIVAMVIASVTGFAQMYYEAWGRLIIVPMGGLEVSMAVHLTAAFVMGVLMVYHFAFYAAGYVAKRARGTPARLEIMFRRKDISDILRNLRYMLGVGEKPRFDKYTYGQKFDYWGIYWGTLILGVPGVLMWMYGFDWLGGIPFIFHTKEAMLAVLWLLVFHFYQTHFNPRTFPMDKVFLTGDVSRQELIEEHPMQFERIGVS
jgi:formate dehydrogenase subunit gamma